MDITTILVSAGLSAIVSAIVSILAVSQTTTRQLKATRADDARRAIASIVAPVRLEVLQYVRKRRKSAGREPSVAVGNDIILTAQILAQVIELPRWRRWIVLWRTRKIFGVYCTEIAELSAVQELTTAGGFLATVFQAQVRDDICGQPTDSLLHGALTKEPGHQLQRKLMRQLSRLASCR